MGVEEGLVPARAQNEEPPDSEANLTLYLPRAPYLAGTQPPAKTNPCMGPHISWPDHSLQERGSISDPRAQWVESKREQVPESSPE